ncbi:uncharacterized protein N7500_007611 [Penicillium coprophilum]|uniref:uncharacterized protein n=1 Tax=Penicillium coprophilum TaxID=36646 RepID=UPI0023820371|nr:uncharacterized protein N7500_007611 [Penicillium coprophilum]KAJ5157960.1 hypothetical protein N7500_007611 [Penicillium coprophilum]
MIEHRGSEQLTRQEGLGLFTNLRAQISISQIYQAKYSSPITTQLTEDVKRYRDPDQMVDDVGRVVIQLTNFCATIKDGSITQPSEIIRRTMSLDTDLMSILFTAPPSWRYQTVKVPVIDGEPVTRTVWGDSYHVCRNLSVSGVWNNARSARLLMHKMLLGAVNSLEDSSPGSSGLLQQQLIASQSRQIAHQLVDDICASVHFHLGLANRSSSLETVAAHLGAFLPNTNMIHSETHYPSPLPPSFEVPGAGGVTLAWTLLIAANSGFASPPPRKWIIGCLEKIGHSMESNKALTMAQSLQDGMDSRAWMSPEVSPSHDTLW